VIKSIFIHTRVLQLPRQYKRLVMLLADAVMIPLALWSAFALRLGSVSLDLAPFWWLFILAPLVSLPTFTKLGLYRAVVRYMGPQAAFAVLKGVTATTLALMAAVVLMQIPGTPRSVFVIFWLIAVLYVGGSRFFLRAYFHWLIKSYTERQLVAIYGAGGAGLQLSSALANGGDYLPVAYIDDNKALHGSVFNGIQVYPPNQLEDIVKNLNITQVLLAVPSISRMQRQAILNRLGNLPVYVRTVPSMPDLLSGRVALDEIQDVEIEDLLGRESVPPNLELLEQSVRRKTVAVTGAAGSIGSELCRQILEVKPQRLLLFEISEYGLYNIDKELRGIADSNGLDVELVPVLGSVQNQTLMQRALERFKVDVLFHAAAYKHVPMVEHNIIAGVRNNVFGTLSLAKAAIAAKIDTFVLVSTDKAVRPTNVMGATKRIAELILQGLSKQEDTDTCFCMVRFGNVLGSSGSVVPLFLKQIHEGGPVTVTHPEVSRYFMTIPEAAQLVIQTGAIAQGGDVFVLDMGESVDIIDLARKMVHLMGFEISDEEHPNGDIQIQYTGLRPGEKLKEELLIGENLTGTEHSKIMRAEEECLFWNEIEALLDQLESACNEFDFPAIRDILLQGVVGFAPQHAFVDRLSHTALQPVVNLKFDPQSNVARLFPQAER